MIALVTGTGKGIGRALALDLVSLGYTVVFHYRSTPPPTIPQQCLAAQADLTVVAEVQRLFETIDTRYGVLDVLINTVGNLGSYQTLTETTLEEFDDVMDTNVRATWLCLHYGVPLLRHSTAGRVINFGCATADQVLARKYTVPYYIAKAGVITLTKSWAELLAPAGITVNAISPGIVANSKIQQSLPMGRPASFKDIQQAVRWLLSPAASYVSGANLEISGGWVPQH